MSDLTRKFSVNLPGYVFIWVFILILVVWTFVYDAIFCRCAPPIG